MYRFVGKMHEVLHNTTHHFYRSKQGNFCNAHTNKQTVAICQSSPKFNPRFVTELQKLLIYSSTLAVTVDIFYLCHWRFEAGGNVLSGLPTAIQPSFCPLTPILRDVTSLYLVERFLWNLPLGHSSSECVDSQGHKVRGQGHAVMPTEIP